MVDEFTAHVSFTVGLDGCVHGCRWQSSPHSSPCLHRHNVTLRRDPQAEPASRRIDVAAGGAAPEAAPVQHHPLVGLTASGGRVRATLGPNGVTHVVLIHGDRMSIVDAQTPRHGHLLARLPRAALAALPDVAAAADAAAPAPAHVGSLVWTFVRPGMGQAAAGAASAATRHLLGHVIYPDAYHGPYGRMCSFMENQTLSMNLTMVADVGFGRAVSGNSTVDKEKVYETMITYLNVANVLYEDMVRRPPPMERERKRGRRTHTYIHTRTRTQAAAR